MPDDEDVRPAPTASRSGMHRVTFKTDIGRSHRVNQDAGGAWTWLRPNGEPVSLLVVADGVSAGRRSEDVSRMASAVLLDRMEPALQSVEHTTDELISLLGDVVRELNHEIAVRPYASPASADATTLVAALCVGAAGGGVWVGDSRVYHVTDDGARQLTRDHSWAEGAVTQGFMTREQAAADPRAHMITRWLGPPDGDDPGVESFTFELATGDVVLCCSDGLYHYFSPPVSDSGEMSRIIRSHELNIDRAAGHLVDLALERGGHDNITIAAMTYGGSPHSGD